MAFDRGMLEIARQGSFTDIVTAMFAAEWMYWTWCSRAASREIADPHIRRWVDMHADEAFAAQARWLKTMIDRHAGPGDLARLSAIFGRVTELEIRVPRCAAGRLARRTPRPEGVDRCTGRRPPPLPP